MQHSQHVEVCALGDGKQPHVTRQRANLEQDHTHTTRVPTALGMALVCFWFTTLLL